MSLSEKLRELALELDGRHPFLAAWLWERAWALREGKEGPEEVARGLCAWAKRRPNLAGRLLALALEASEEEAVLGALGE